jgi:hypothetical protein
VNPGVYYLHIAKTAGTTLRWLLEGKYPASRCVYIYNQADRIRFARMNAEARARILCISSNAPLGTYPDLQSRLHVITMLREPITRMLSLYVYRRAHPTFRTHPIQTMPVLDYFDLMAAQREDNAQVRLLSGQGYNGDATVETLACAKDNLRDACDAFGLQERFNESLVIFSRVFGWRRMAFVIRNTASSNSLMKDENIHNHIEGYNRLDIELYDYAQQLFAERLAARQITDDEQMWVYEAGGLERASIYAQRAILKLYRLR